MRSAIFFDRDGVVNHRIKGGYVRNWQEFEFVAGFGNILKVVKRLGYLAIVITNQRGVGRGLMSQGDLDTLHGRIQSTLQAEFGVQFDDIISCTDLDDSSLRRKPSPAMLLEAATKWDIDLKESWMVGDSSSDMEAGNAAGTRTAFLITMHTETIPNATVVLQSLEELVPLISAPKI